MAKKKISVTEKHLRNKLNYQRRKQKVLFNELKGIEKKLKPKYNDFNEIKKYAKHYDPPTESKRSKQYIKDLYFNKMYKIQNEIDKFESQLQNKFKKKKKYDKTTVKKNKNEIRYELGLVWEVDRNTEKQLFNNEKIKYVENLNKKKDLDLIIDKINISKLNMSSKDLMYLVGRDFKFRIVVQNEEYDLE